MSTWQDTLKESAEMQRQSAVSRKQATALLWQGALGAIEEWDQTIDPDGAGLYNECMEALGGSARKGDASKIRTVAVAVERGEINADAYSSLAAAYTAVGTVRRNAARRAAEAAEDDAAAAAIGSLPDEEDEIDPVTEAVRVLLKLGVERTASELMDGLGVDNLPAHCSLLRAISTEINNRSKPAEEKAEAVSTAKPEPAPAKPARKRAKPAKALPKPEPTSAPRRKPVQIKRGK